MSYCVQKFYKTPKYTTKCKPRAGQDVFKTPKYACKPRAGQDVFLKISKV